MSENQAENLWRILMSDIIQKGKHCANKKENILEKKNSQTYY